MKMTISFIQHLVANHPMNDMLLDSSFYTMTFHNDVPNNSGLFIARHIHGIGRIEWMCVTITFC